MESEGSKDDFDKALDQLLKIERRYLQLSDLPGVNVRFVLTNINSYKMRYLNGERSLELLNLMREVE